MTRLSEKKQELYRLANKHYRQSIFDVVFAILKKRRYEKYIEGGMLRRESVEL